MTEALFSRRRWARGTRPRNGDDPLRAYLAVCGMGALDSCRLFLGFATAGLRKALTPKEYAGVGASLPGRTPVAVRLGGGVAHVRPGTNDLDLLVHHEPVTRRWVQVKPGDTFVDVGAHIGLYSLLAATAGAKVLALEPERENRSLLEVNLRRNGIGEVHVIPIAASDRSGFASLRIPGGPNRGTASIETGGPAPSVGPFREVSVLVDRLDAILAPFHLKRVDWLKIDVEGHEVAVLRGAPETIQRTVHLILEVTPRTADACRAIVSAAGFRLVDQEPGSPASNWLLEREAA